MKALTLSYLAGFVDGEGYIGIVKKYTKQRNIKYNHAVPIIYVGNTNKKVLLIFKKLFGGKIYKCNREKPRKLLYSWKAIYNKAHKISKLLYPYSKMKRKQYELIFKYFNNTNHREKMKLINLSKKLNKKGR